MTSTTNRRAVLAGIAAAPAIGTAALAAQSDDPIFAAIERHRAAQRAIDAANRSAVSQSDEVLDKLLDDDGDAIASLLATTPTTVAGIAAVLRHVGECSYSDDNPRGAEFGLFAGWANPWPSSGARFLPMIAAALDKAVQS